MISETMTPKASGYRFPAEWEKHRATWLSYPHDDSYSWPGTLQNIFPFYHQFIREISSGEKVCINIRNSGMKEKILKELRSIQAEVSNVELFVHPTNDAWCRDHGPAFLINEAAKEKKVIVKWNYNAWGGKYPHDLDDQIPEQIALQLGIPVYYPGIVMEGGAVDFNGRGTLLTTEACLLNENRNPGLDREQIEQYLCDYYGVEQILWLGDGIDGDDTNGHIDDITRFFREDAVITAVESDKSDPNHRILRENLRKLKTMRLLSGKQLDIAELPMPSPVIFEGQRLPASYANFYISNSAVVVPLYRCKEDDVAMSLLETCFPDRRVVGIDSVEIIWGLGSWHCLSQQEPEV